MSDEEDWGAVHLEGIHQGYGQGSVKDTRVLPLQPCLRTVSWGIIMLAQGLAHFLGLLP